MAHRFNYPLSKSDIPSHCTFNIYRAFCEFIAKSWLFSYLQETSHKRALRRNGLDSCNHIWTRPTRSKVRNEKRWGVKGAYCEAFCFLPCFCCQEKLTISLRRWQFFRVSIANLLHISFYHFLNVIFLGTTLLVSFIKIVISLRY